MKYSTRMFTLLLSVLLVWTVGPAHAEIRLPSVFADGMVLQRNQSVPVWGWAEPGERVMVALGGTSSETTAGDDGRWRVSLPELAGQKTPMDLLINGSKSGKAVVHNVLVGDVWLCSGPSNIFWPVKKCEHSKEEIAQAKYPEIRFFMVEKAAMDKPQEDCAGAWTVCSPETIGEASGVAYFFARRIHQEEGVPIGVLQSFWGGSLIEAWTSLETLEAAPSLQPILAEWVSKKAEFDNIALPAYKETVLGHNQKIRIFDSGVGSNDQLPHNGS